LTGEIDAAILVAPAFDIPKTLNSVSLKREELVFLSQANQRGEVNAVLASQPYIRYDPTSWGGRQAHLYIEEQGITPTLLCDLDALEPVLC